MDIFQILFYVPTFNILMFFDQIFGSIGWAIIGIALISKLITFPLTKGQLEQAEKNKQFTGAIKAIQKKYKFNKEKQAQELAKIQAKALPGQLKGCLSIIVFIFLFIQIRGTIVDLVNRGYHAFNTVAYSEELKRDEDSLIVDLGTELAEGTHSFEISLEATNGNKLTKNIEFEVYSDIDKRIEEIKIEELDKSDNQREFERNEYTQSITAERESDMAIYNDKITPSHRTIAIKSFLIFPVESVERNIISQKDGKFNFYFRPPSGSSLISDNTMIKYNGIDITDNVIISQGEEFDLEFMGMNLAKVGADFDITDFGQITPYIILAALSAYTQYLVTKLYSGTSVQTRISETDKNGKVKPVDSADMDMSEALADSFKTMNKALPIFTFIISMGYFGGANFLPTGVTLFWTAQNVFVIIQQLAMNPKENYLKLKTTINAFINKNNGNTNIK